VLAVALSPAQEPSTRKPCGRPKRSARPHVATTPGRRSTAANDTSRRTRWACCSW
jgi:hypothetical protein